MSFNYSGNPSATQAPAPAPAKNAVPIATIPSDGDALNVASITQFVKMLTDFAVWQTHHGFILDVANVASGNNTFSGANGFSGTNTFALPMVSSTSSTNAALTTTTAPAAGSRKYIFSFPVGVAGLASIVSLYLEGNYFLEFVVNATWTGTLWSRTNGGAAATKFTLLANGIRMDGQPVGSPDTWADNAWVRPLTLQHDPITQVHEVNFGAGKQIHLDGTGSLVLQATSGISAVSGSGLITMGTTTLTRTSFSSSGRYLDLKPAGVEGDGPVRVSVGGGVTGSTCGHSDLVFGHGAFGKAFPANPSTITYQSEQSNNLINAPGGGAWTVLYLDRYAMSIYGQCNNGGNNLNSPSFLVNYLVS